MFTQTRIPRRVLLKRFSAISVAAALPSGGAAKAEERDHFGGLKSVRFESSGFFRVAQNDRWWFVTPDGAAFLSFGLNHPNQEYLLQEYNRDHWLREFGAASRADPAFGRSFADKVLRDLEMLRMNTIGTHSRKEEFGTLRVPYVQGLYFVRTPYWAAPAANRFDDVFSPEFEARCERIAARVVAPRANDRYLLGYTFTDCPILTDRDAAAHGQVAWGRSQPELPTWPRVLRNLGGGSRGKKAFVDLMRGRHAGIAEFNRVYGTKFLSFDGLLAARRWSSVRAAEGVDDRADNHAFLLQILDRYYSVACNVIRRHDKKHLIFGDILNAQTAPPDDVVALVGRYTDLIAYQYYDDYDAHRQLLDRWSELTGKPLYHADTCFSVAYQQMPSPIGAVCPDQQTRARRFYECASRSFSRPDLIGWNWCGWMDAWAAWKVERQHSGLQDPFGRFHDPMPETMARLGQRLYEFGLSGGS